VEECLFQINAATRAGGAIAISAGSIEMIASSVKSNYAGEADGGVFINGVPLRHAVSCALGFAASCVAPSLDL
jgi:hypothetical protein